MVKKQFLYLIFFILFNIKAYAYHYDYTHTKIEKFLYSSTDTLDRFLSGKNYFVPNNTLVSGELSYVYVNEQSTNPSNNLDFKVRLRFPRVEKNVKSVFENYRIEFETYKENNTLDKEKSKKNGYMLGIIRDKAKLGIQFRGLNSDLFASYKLYNNKKLNNNWSSYIENKIGYFVREGFINTFQIILDRKIYENINFSFNNSYQYKAKNNNEKSISNSLNFSYNSDYKSTYTYILSSNFQRDDTKPFTVDYYTGVAYRKFYYKNLNYYQVDTGLTFREENSFDAKARVMITFGVLFGKSKKVFKKAQ